MKKIYAIIIIGAAILVAACGFKEDYSLKTPVGFDVAAPVTAKVGEPVVFNLSGDPNIITFYSGEFGHLYENHDKDILYPAQMTISFQTETSSVETLGMNPESVPFKISTDFKGDYTKEGIEAATWTDISNKFSWPTGQGQTVESGEVDMADIFPDETSPIYLLFDFKVKAVNAEQTSGRVQWYIRNLFINGGTQLGISEMYNIFTCGWTVVPIENYDKNTSLPQLPTATNFRIQLRTQFRPAVDIEYALVSVPIYPASSVNVGWDKGQTIKSYSDPKMKSYSYTFDEPGEYVVTFVGINANQEGKEEIVRNVTVKVIQDEGSLVSPEPGEWKQ